MKNKQQKMDYYLEHRSLENCLKYINEYNPQTDEIIEMSISKKNKPMNEFLLTTPNSVLLLDKNIVKKDENILLKEKGNLYEIYLTIKNEFAEILTYEDIYNAFTKLKDVLLKEKISEICCIKKQKLFEHLEFIKIKQILRYIYRDSGISITFFIDN